MSNAATPEVTAVFHPGTYVDENNWSSAYCTFTINGVDAGFSSDCWCDLLDIHGLDSEQANKLVSEAWNAAELAEFVSH